jgi:regulatory protein
MAMTYRRDTSARPPLDSAALERAALRYAERYATTRARLAAYLERKLRERGWAESAPPAVDRLVARMAELGYVDDAAFAAARAAALARRGYGPRRVADALRAAGVGEEDGAGARSIARDGAWTAALRFAERRRIGPFAREEPDRAARERALAALLRAGHPMALSRRIASARPGEIPEEDER